MYFQLLFVSLLESPNFHQATLQFVSQALTFFEFPIHAIQIIFKERLKELSACLPYLSKLQSLFLVSSTSSLAAISCAGLRIFQGATRSPKKNLPALA